MVKIILNAVYENRLVDLILTVYENGQMVKIRIQILTGWISNPFKMGWLATHLQKIQIF